MEENSFTVQPLTPIAGVAPGQSLVLYDGDRVVGGGLIKTAERRFV
jgi:tRNA-specific 2-thiouridylase